MFNVLMLLVDGWTLGIALDTSCFADCITADNQALEFVALCYEVISTLGGAMSLVVKNTLFGDDWQTQLNDAAEKPLGNISLESLAEALKNILICVTADDELISVPADVEAKVFLDFVPRSVPGEFSHCARPLSS